MSDNETLTMTLQNGAYEQLNEVFLEAKGMTLDEFAKAHPNKTLEVLKEYFELSMKGSRRINLRSGNSHTVILGNTGLVEQSEEFQSLRDSFESAPTVHLKVERPQTLWQFLTGQVTCRTIVIERQ